MSFLRKLAGLTLLTVATACIGRADIVYFASFGSTASVPAGESNSATTYAGGGPTYNIAATSPWHSALGGSSWVSFDPNSYPGGSVTPPNGTYTYQSTFLVTGGDVFSGLLYVMADDSAGVLLNGAALTALNGVTPGLGTVATYFLPQTYLVSGTNTLTFNVQQLHGGATGLDFAGGVSVTPESGSFILLSLGLFTAAGLVGLKAAKSKLVPVGE